MMTLEEYRGDYDYSPMTIVEYAEGAVLVNDAPDLSEAAAKFLAAHRDFISALGEVNVELG